MENTPLVSVLLTTYNREKYLSYCIESVLNQTYKNLEFIIIDDGSTDSSMDLIRRYHDPRIKAFHLNENHHISYATNVGLNKVSGDYLAYIDSDDVWELTKLEKQLRLLQSTPSAKACFTWVNIIDENGTVCNQDYPDLIKMYQSHTDNREKWLRHFFFEGNRLPKPAALVDMEAARTVGDHTLALVQAHDFDWWVRFTCQYSFLILEEPLLNIRRFQDPADNASGISPKQDTRFLNEYMMIRSKFLDRLSPKDFIHTFHELFRNPAASTPEELECEKAFLLLKCCYKNPEDNYPILGLYRLAELLQNPDTCKVLESVYQFTPKTYYELDFQPLYYSYDLFHLSEYQKNLLKLKDESISSQQAYIKNLEEAVQGQKDYLEQREQCIQSQQAYIKNLEQDLHSRQPHIDALAAQIQDLNERLASSEAQTTSLRTELQASKQEVESLKNSTSWKLTKPLRAIRHNNK